MLKGEHSAILSTCIKLPFVIKIFIVSIFEWPFYTGFTVVFNFLYYPYWEILHAFLLSVEFFQNQFFQEYIRISNSLDL